MGAESVEERQAQGGSEEQVLTAARPTVPQAAPYVLERVFRLGALSSRMASAMHHEPISDRGMRNILQKLVACNLLESASMVVESSPAVANVTDPDGSRETFMKPASSRPHEKIYELSEEGKTFVSGDQELPARRVHQLYNRTHSTGRRQHTLLRNEYLVRLLEDAQGTLPYAIDGYWGEAGAGPILLEKKSRLAHRSVSPDGLVLLSSGHEEQANIYPVFIEADTGTQRGGHIKEKIQQYAELFLSELLAAEESRKLDEQERILVARRNERWLPRKLILPSGALSPVVFVSYYADRTVALRNLIEEVASKDAMFKRLDRYMQKRGMGPAVSTFLCTNLQALNRRGSWVAYWEPTGDEVGPLL